MERGAVGGQRRDPCGAGRVVAEHRLERAAAERRERDLHGLVLGAGREAEQSLVTVLAQIDDRVLPHRDVTQPAPRERIAREADPDQARVGREQLGVPALGRVPRHRAPCVLAQKPSSPSSSPAKTIGTPGIVIWIPIPTS